VFHLLRDTALNPTTLPFTWAPIVIWDIKLFDILLLTEAFLKKLPSLDFNVWVKKDIGLLSNGLTPVDLDK